MAKQNICFSLQFYPIQDEIRNNIFSMKLRIVSKRYFNSIDEFSFVKQIGVGSFGSVKLALHLQTNKCYAVKIVNLSEATTDNQILLLEREINLHTVVDHPHIIKLWDTLIEANTVYMIMELAQNGTLFTYQSKNKTISQAETFKFFSQTLSAVKYMHSNDMMHRDLKPQNILLDNAYNVKICDLGWATDKIEMKRKTFCGTYQYMAPEMVFEKQYNYNIDVWALGVLLYELLHNFAPFPAKDLEEMKEKVKQGHYELGSNFCKELKNLIVQILQFEPEERPSITTIFAHPWMQKMRKEIKGQINKIKSQLQGSNSSRAKVSKQKTSIVKNNKFHRRFDSLMNDNFIHKNTNESVHRVQSKVALQKMMVENKQKRKKKCKTQGEQSMQKVLSQSIKIGIDKMKWKKQKQNKCQLKLSPSQLSKTFAMKSGEHTLTNLKMKRNDKMDLLSKTPLDKKKAYFRSQKDQQF